MAGLGGSQGAVGGRQLASDSELIAFGAEGRQILQGIAKAGFGFNNFQSWYDPMVLDLNQLTGTGRSPSGWALNQSVNAGFSGVNDTPGGVQELLVAPSIALEFAEIQLPTSTPIFDITAERWYFAGRARVDGPPAATVDTIFGLINNNGDVRIRVGVVGAVSTTHYSIFGEFGANPNQVSNIPIDGNFHTFEIWSAGNDYVRWSVDGIEQTALGSVTGGNDAHLWATAVNTAASAAVRGWQIDDIFFMFQNA